VKVTIVGAGYVGLTSGVGFALLGHEVVLYDVNHNHLRSIREGHTPFYEPGLSDAIQKTASTGHLLTSFELQEAAREAEVILVCVPTPSAPDGHIDLSAVDGAVADIGRAIASNKHYQVVVIRSTVVPGTTKALVRETLGKAIEGRTAPYGLAANPEFFREGAALEDFLTADRVVIGGIDEVSASTVARLYDTLSPPMVMVDPTTAEMIKYASNGLLATLVSYSNELAQICERLGDVDVADVLRGVHLDRRLSLSHGNERVTAGIVSYLWAGCGYGGSCLPKDMRALVQVANDLGYEAPLLDAVNRVNTVQPERLVEQVELGLGDLAGRNVGVLGLAFKSGTEDLREAPGIAIVESLVRRGAVVSAFDPMVDPGRLPETLRGRVTCVSSVEEVAAGADAVVITTTAPEFQRIGEVLSDRPRVLIVDGRRTLDRRGFAAGDYVGVGWQPSSDDRRQ
jgi:UDPglucose 6-dehydrogenase